MHLTPGYYWIRLHADADIEIAEYNTEMLGTPVWLTCGCELYFFPEDNRELSVLQRVPDMIVGIQENNNA